MTRLWLAAWLFTFLLSGSGGAFAYCYTETTNDVSGTTLSYTGEGYAGSVPYGSARYLKNDGYSPNCRVISNASTAKKTVYVAAKNQSEWSSFLSKLPSGVTVSECTYLTTTICVEDSGGGNSGNGEGCNCGTDGSDAATGDSGAGTW